MFGVGSEVTKLAREKRGASARVDNPCRIDISFFTIDGHGKLLSIFSGEFTLGHLRRSPQIAACLYREFEQMRIEFRAIDLECLQSRLITRADFHAIIERLIGAIRKPHSQSLFRQLLVTEVVSETENARHVTTAQLGRRFADFAIELRGFFDDQNACVRPLALEHERGGSAGKRAADNDHVIIMLHRSANDGVALCETQGRARPPGAPQISVAAVLTVARISCDV